MRADRERASFSDLLGIQVLRRLENNEPKYFADIDVPLAEEAQRDRQGKLRTPARLLADRADKILQTRFGVNAGWIGELVGWLRVLRFLGYVVILLIAFGLAEPWLRQGEIVNVEWIFGFLLTLVISMTITALLMITATFAKRRREDAPDQSARAGGVTITNTFAKLLVVHWLLQFVIRRAIPWIERRILNRAGDKSPEELRRIEQVSEALYDTLSRQSRRMALEAAATSNTVWCLLSVGVLLSLGKMGLFREYDFRWRATIVSEEFMQQTTQAMARPLAGLPLVSYPSEEDVRWLATGEVRPSVTNQTQAELHQEHRQLWGRLFLAFLLYYGVLPRLALMILSRWMAARAWKGLEPKLNDPYFQSILKNLETPPFDTSQEEREPDDSPPETSPRFLHEVLASSETTIIDAPFHDESTVVQAELDGLLGAGDKTVVLSYDVMEPDDGWLKTLSLEDNGSMINLGNVGDRAARGRINGQLKELRPDIGLLVVVANLMDNPDAMFERFLGETIQHLPPTAGRAMVLIGGERVRKRYAGDAQKIATRVDLWKRKGAACGVEGTKIVEFDLEHATTAGRELLHDRLQTFLPHPADQETISEIFPAILRGAGLFRKATSVVIMGCVNEETLEETPAQLQETTLKLHQKLRTLYQKQASALEKAFANVEIDTSRIRSAISDKAHFAQHFDQLEQFSRMAAVVQRYTKNLSPKWAVGGGLVCALGSGALAVLAAPALLPALIPAAAIGAKAGLLGGVLAAHAPHLAAKLRGGPKDASVQLQDESEETLEGEFSLDDLVRSSTLFALILELQGNPEDRIAQTLEKILSGTSEEALTTLEAASQWLNDVTNRTEDALAHG